jgi:hypothetical protein
MSRCSRQLSTAQAINKLKKCHLCNARIETALCKENKIWIRCWYTPGLLQRRKMSFFTENMGKCNYDNITNKLQSVITSM